MKARLKSLFCYLFGHSRIVTTKRTTFYCGRCGKDTGDWFLEINLAGVCDPDIDNEPNRDAYYEMTWKDKLLVPVGFNLYED